MKRTSPFQTPQQVAAPVGTEPVALPGKPVLTLYEPGALRVTVALPQSQSLSSLASEV